MATTWIVKAVKTTRGVQELFWSGSNWTAQMWDSWHFEALKDAEDFIETRVDHSKKSGWSFEFLPVDPDTG